MLRMFSADRLSSWKWYISRAMMIYLTVNGSQTMLISWRPVGQLIGLAYMYNYCRHILWSVLGNIQCWKSENIQLCCSMPSNIDNGQFSAMSACFYQLSFLVAKDSLCSMTSQAPVDTILLSFLLETNPSVLNQNVKNSYVMNVLFHIGYIPAQGRRGRIRRNRWYVHSSAWLVPHRITPLNIYD